MEGCSHVCMNCVNQEDYDDMYNATEDEVKPYFPLVESFISVMEELITFK